MKKILYIAAFLATALALAGCNKQNNDSWYYATVTCRPAADGTFYMKLDDTTALVSSNITKYPYGKAAEKRATVFYSIDKKAPAIEISGYKRTYSVTLTSIDTLYAKKPVQSMGSFKEDSTAFGNNTISPVLVGNIFPPTMIEDGYLCISFNFYASGFVTHQMNLVTGVNPENPYEVELRHNACGDDPLYEYRGHMEFPLKSLPDTQGRTVDLRLKWRDMYTGETSSTVFKYCSRTDWPAD